MIARIAEEQKWRGGKSWKELREKGVEKKLNKNESVYIYLYILRRRKRKKKKEKKVNGGSNQSVVGLYRVVSNLINHYTTDPPCLLSTTLPSCVAYGFAKS